MLGVAMPLVPRLIKLSRKVVRANPANPNGAGLANLWSGGLYRPGWKAPPKAGRYESPVGIRDKGPYPGVQRGLMASCSRCSVSAFWIASGAELDVRDDVDAMMVCGLSSPCEKIDGSETMQRRSKSEDRKELRKQRATYEQLIQCRMPLIPTSPKLFPLFESTSLSNSLDQLPYGLKKHRL